MAGEIIKALHEAYVGGIEVLSRYQPWNLLLLLKWTLQEADETSHRRPIATRNDLHVCLNLLLEMEGQIRLPNEYEHVNLFMRHLAFPQFSLQQGPDGAAVARQDILFASLPLDHPFQREFLRLTGIAIADFTEMCVGILSLILKEPSPLVITRQDFHLLEPSLPGGALDKFFRHLSKTIPELRDWLNSPEIKSISVADQKILASPLLKAPLLADGSRYLVYFPPLMLRSLEAIIYRTLRENDPSAFGATFGPIFERYVGDCLANGEISHLDEDLLSAALGGEGKCVDFLVAQEDCTILIDAKGIEMSALGRVSHHAETLLRAIKSSAVKAIAQGVETSLRLRRAGTSALLPWGEQETFLVVVTFDDLFLGSNIDFEAIFGDSLLPRLQRDFGEPLPIPLKNVFFLTIKEFEDLVARIRVGSTTFGAALRHAQSQDAEFRTKKFHFQQHLATLCPHTKLLPMLEGALESLYSRCIQRLPPDSRP
jgi:hypothetical protein